MTPEQLKSSILQYAIQGKLVEQRAEEGTGEELYQQIQKVSKPNKKVIPITESEIPFDIPSSWRWCKFGEIVDYSMGKTPPRAEPIWWKDDIHWVSIADMSEYARVVSTKEKVSFKAVKEKFGAISPQGTLIMSFKLTVGRTSILGIDAVHNEAIISIYPYMDNDDNLKNYLFYILPIVTQWGDSKNAIKGKTLNSKSIANLMIPLAPLNELHRIVVKIKELLPYVDRYAVAYEKLEQFNAKFPEDMKKSILQYAIQGKLVEQRPEDGTGEELYQQMREEIKTLERQKRFKVKDDSAISEDEIPFDIPESWKWLRLGQILNIESGKGLTAKQMRPGEIPVFGGNGITGYHDESLIEKETVVIGRVGFYCGSVHITPKNAWITDNAFITTYPEESINREYLVYVLRHMNLGQNSNATAQPVVSGKKIYPMLFPLPPLAEQKRIVAKIEELMPLCERLK